MVDQHAVGKWLIYDTKRRKDNELQSLKLPCKISKFSIYIYIYIYTIWQIQMKFSKRNSQHVVLISYKFHCDWPHCYKTIRGKVSVIVYAYRQVCMQKEWPLF